LTVKTTILLSLPELLAAVMVTLDVPLALGVPLITPVAVLTPSPGGMPLALKLVGLFVAVIV
jgi:hypothetical protein